MNSSHISFIVPFLAMLAQGLSTFPFTDSSRKWGPVAINHFRLLTGFIALTILVMLIDKKSPVTLFTSPTSAEYLYLFASGIMGLVIGDYFDFHAMAILGAKRSSIFYTVAPGAALGFSFVLLGESIDFVGIIGVFISIAGMIWFTQASDTKEIEMHQVHEYGKISKGVLFGVLAGLCQGLHTTLAKKAITGEPGLLSPMHATWVRLLGATVTYFTFTFITGRFRQNVIMPIQKEKSTIPKAILASIFGMTLSIVLVMWGLTLCKVVVVQTIMSIKPLVIMPMAYVLYKEKMTMKTFIAGVVTIFGVYVLIWRNDITSILSLHLH